MEQDMEIGNNFRNTGVSGNQLNQDFFQDNKDIPKKKKNERRKQLGKTKHRILQPRLRLETF